MSYTSQNGWKRIVRNCCPTGGFRQATFWIVDMDDLSKDVIFRDQLTQHNDSVAEGKKVNCVFDAYLDIETTGLSWQHSEVTVIGVYLVREKKSKLVQLVGRDANADNLLTTVHGVNTFYTYNGSRFDFPFINGSLGVDLGSMAAHHDLMYDCWRCNLHGGFKAAEEQLGIHRQTKGVTGLDAIRLWRRYSDRGDEEALAKLLHYNKEDVVNLKALRESLQLDEIPKAGNERVARWRK